MIDYRQLLIRYMQCVIQCEAISFVEINHGFEFTPDELTALRTIEDEAVQDERTARGYVDQRPSYERQS